MKLEDLNIDTNRILMAVFFFMAGWVWNIEGKMNIFGTIQEELKEDVEYQYKSDVQVQQEWIDFWRNDAAEWRGRYLDRIEKEIDRNNEK